MKTTNLSTEYSDPMAKTLKFNDLAPGTFFRWQEPQEDNESVKIKHDEKGYIVLGTGVLINPTDYFNDPVIAYSNAKLILSL